LNEKHDFSGYFEEKYEVLNEKCDFGGYFDGKHEDLNENMISVDILKENMKLT